MSASAELLSGAGLVLLGSLLSTAGWVYRTRTARAEGRQSQDTAQEYRLGLLETAVRSLEGTIERHTVRIGHVSEELSAVAAIVDRHERWHERGTPGP